MSIKQMVCLIVLFSRSSVFATQLETGRFNCRLLKNAEGSELESFTLLPHDRVHQYVSPERKFFVDLKKVIFESPVKTGSNDPSAKPQVRKVPGLKLTASIYSDFTAHFGATEGLIDKKEAFFNLSDTDLTLTLRNPAPDVNETYLLSCMKLLNVKLPDILKKDKVIR